MISLCETCSLCRVHLLSFLVDVFAVTFEKKRCGVISASSQITQKESGVVRKKGPVTTGIFV